MSHPDLLAELRTGTRESLDRIVPLVYEELRAIAHRRLALREGNGTLQTTGLVHEAYLKLLGHARPQGKDRAHFLALASVTMRHVLVDRAKARLAVKRGGVRERVTFDEEKIPIENAPETFLQLHEALDRLAELQPRLAHVVECRFFGGLTEEDTAEALGVTVRTVQRDWAKARMLLRRELDG